MVFVSAACCAHKCTPCAVPTVVTGVSCGHCAGHCYIVWVRAAAWSLRLVVAMVRPLQLASFVIVACDSCVGTAALCGFAVVTCDGCCLLWLAVTRPFWPAISLALSGTGCVQPGAHSLPAAPHCSAALPFLSDLQLP